MSFILTRPASPAGRDAHHTEEDSLSAALHAALSAFSNNPSQFQHNTNVQPTHEPSSMHHEPKDKSQPYLDILVASDTLCLRGVGVDVNPALLSGNVVLHLPEPMSIKEITLQFRGKARLPVSAAEPLSLSSSQLTYIVCNHEWSFLEGDRHHAHTLKAGRHLFPFQLQIGGSLPSSISTSALGGASVQYKLRASAVRGGFGFAHRSLEASLPVSIMRGFSSEALEYQQTLEIENTWPEKLMYSIMIPHKAWAAGEKVTAVVKFSPLVKGARVQHVTTTVNETVKLYARSGTQENTRVISSTRHDIVQGKAVCVDEQHLRYRIPLLHSHPHVSSRHSTSTPGTPGFHGHNAGTAGSYFPTHTTTVSHPASPVHGPADLAPLTTTTTNSSSSSGVGSSSRPSGMTSSNGSSAEQSSRTSAEISMPAQPPPPPQSEAEADMEPSVDVVTTLGITVPMHATPSHSLEPIQVTHRIRWSIMISNLDGHTSELRCSLPLHILDARLHDEARAATMQTRRLLLGAQDVEGGSAVDAHGEGEDEEDLELPSYPAHVRDRVANAFLPESAVMRVVNPWVVNGMSPTIPLPHSVMSELSSGIQSPAAWETWQVPQAGPHGPPPRHHLPQEPAPGAAPLEWVNTELLLSLGREAPEAPLPPPPAQQRPTPPSRTPSESASTSRHGSRFPSRRGSRASSPVRGEPGERTSGTPSPHGHHPGETYVHSHSTASRNLHGLFNIAMKPFSTLGSTFSLGSRTASHASLNHGHAHGHGRSGLGHAHTHSDPHSPSSLGSRSAAASTANLHEPPPPAPLTSVDLLHRAFTEVPDYDMASRGFLGGGVTPLDSLRGLPSYEAAAAERSLSDTDLAGMFAAAQQQANQAAVQRARNARSQPHTPEPQPS
ncbi:hypothetical protein CERSUDRAFT_114332 [Gelatoporia subvermispora B]|uniref:Arrestin C-terminal-like domain-containing protein n=1 Tax=Ceriporiopsis subvermispora (strain B) TaxID=914234 RepID=M2PMQ8_CERS8|nr:hypothetical protein CERSUDRAFT_114332 [Gelatoporia subvermispora B]